MRGDPENPRDWFLIAQRDFEMAKQNRLEKAYPYALFWLQQASEKSLKGWLIGKGWRLIKTHDLQSLSIEVAQFGLDLSWFSNTAARLTDLYFSERYVTQENDPEPTPEEVNKLAEDVERLFSQLLKTL